MDATASARPFSSARRLAGLFEAEEDFSDGTVFTFREGGERRVLKILGPHPAGDGALARTEARVDGVARLAAGGEALVRPLPSRAGARLETATAGGQGFVAYTYRFATGRAAHAADAVIRSGAYARALGAALAQLHAAAETIPEALSPEGTSGRTPALGGWRGEWEFFRAWCRDAEVGRAWARLREALLALPVTKTGYGFVHNDAHPGNFVLDPARGDAEPALRLIDFDVADYHWFACDAAGAIYGLATLDAGGLETPRGPSEATLAAAGAAFWEGYRRHRDPGAAWLARVPLFVQYRRCLLFMPFQDLIAAQPAWRERWKRRILEADERLFG